MPVSNQQPIPDPSRAQISFCTKKQGALLITTTALAAILLIGGTLGALSVVTLPIGSIPIYICTAAGGAILFFNAARVIKLTNTYYNKQYTQEQINQWIDPTVWHEKVTTLEPKEFSRFNLALQQPDSNTGRPAIWGFFCKSPEGEARIYAFKTFSDMNTQLIKLGYTNRNDCIFDVSQVEGLYNLSELQSLTLKPDECFSCILNPEEGSNLGPVYAVRYPHGEVLYFRESHNQQGEGVKGYTDLGEIKRTQDKKRTELQQKYQRTLGENECVIFESGGSHLLVSNTFDPKACFDTRGEAIEYIWANDLTNVTEHYSD